MKKHNSTSLLHVRLLFPEPLRVWEFFVFFLSFSCIKCVNFPTYAHMKIYLQSIKYVSLSDVVPRRDTAPAVCFPIRNGIT